LAEKKKLEIKVRKRREERRKYWKTNLESRERHK